MIQSQVHRSLTEADNALGEQSENHPDGWGVAYYVDGAPHLTRSASTALSDKVFHRLSGVVASETVVAHVRRATAGSVNVLNCHPFQYGRWVFAHNGDVPGVERHREHLMQEVAPRLRRFVLGQTDSELLFFLVLTELSRYGALGQRFDLSEVVEALRRALRLVRQVCDDGETKNADGTLGSLLTCVLTDGATMAAVQGGKELYWSTHKTRCADRGSCPSLAEECEAPTTTGFVNHLLFSSEPLSGENVWNKMAQDDIVGVDWRMRLHRGSIAKGALPVVES